MKNFKQRYLVGVAAIALALPGTINHASADQALDAVMARLDKLEKENSKLKGEVKQLEHKTASKPSSSTTSDVVPVSIHPSTRIAPGSDGGVVNVKAGPGYATASGEEDGWFFRKKPGSKGLTFLTPGGEITAYGQLDVSLDDTTKGIGGLGSPGDRPVGNVGWMPALSTNISYFGLRGSQRFDEDIKFVYQLETQIDITATSGTGESNSNDSNIVKGALTSRNSYIGIQSSEWGAIKGGKTDAPYKNSTATMNPFSGMLGDYQVIMGNTGGDNRVEFGTRLDHSIWYESPDWHGLSFAALFSPGQNRADNSDNLAAGESDCAGGNNPSSGGFTTCADGAFSDAVSVSATYKTKIDNIGVLVTGAYERHQKVNRSSDIDPAGPFASLAGQDIADEDAAKIGLQLKLPTKTTVSGIYETMHRDVPSVLTFQNERQRDGTWFALTQEITPADNISFGWAHAFASPGDPGQHNTPGGANPHNDADMLTAAYKHTIRPGLMWYVDWAATYNDTDAHFDLGAGGRGVTTDCHDANSNPTSGGGIGVNPHCFAGGTLMGVSTGIKYNF